LWIAVFHLRIVRKLGNKSRVGGKPQAQREAVSVGTYRNEFEGQPKSLHELTVIESNVNGNHEVPPQGGAIFCGSELDIVAQVSPFLARVPA